MKRLNVAPEVSLLHMLQVLRRRLTNEEGQSFSKFGVVLTPMAIDSIGATAAPVTSARP